MRKLFVAFMALCTICASQTFAQKKVELQHEVHAGLGVSHLRGVNSTGKAGFTAGWKAEYELPFITGMFVNGGIDLNQKGYRANGNRTNMFYANIPIHLGYRYDFNKDWSAGAELGPYFGAGLGGKKRGHDNSGQFHKQGIFANDGFNAKRFDWGIGFHLSTIYKNKYKVGMGFDWGCYDISPDGSGSKNFTFSLITGYYF